MRPIAPSILLVASLLAAGSASGGPEAGAPPPSFRVAGDVEAPGEWTVERLAKEHESSIRVVEWKTKDGAARARCVPLLALVESAKPRVDAAVKGHRLAFVVAVRGRDGYTAAFSLGELLPEHGRRDVWLALDHDGKPLDAEHAPVEVLVPDDEKPSRHVRGIESLTVIDTRRLAVVPPAK